MTPIPSFVPSSIITAINNADFSLDFQLNDDTPSGALSDLSTMTSAFELTENGSYSLLSLSSTPNANGSYISISASVITLVVKQADLEALNVKRSNYSIILSDSADSTDSVILIGELLIKSGITNVS